MIITQRSTTIETNSDGFDIAYTIEDPTIIMQTLANLYSNPLKVIVQEYMCNARDAHREIGNTEPIVVTMPDYYDQFISIRDYGPSLDLERIKNVFCVFGKSTKNKDSKQTGGYGIGAKSAFAYCNSFSVKSYTDGVLRVYSIYKDETFKPHLKMMSEVQTSERNGVDIVIPIKLNDIENVNNYIHEIITYWNEEVVIKNNKNDVTKKPIDYFFTMDNWAFVNNRITNSNKMCVSGSPYIILDGVKYPIDVDIIGNHLDGSMHFLLGIHIHIFADVQEYIPAPNREALRYDSDTIKKICDVFSSIYSYIMEQFEDEISNCKNGLEIGTCLQNFNNKFSISASIKKYVYRDFVIPYDGLNIKDNGFLVQIVDGDGEIISDSSKLNYEYPVIINDEPNKKPSRPRIRNYFEQNDYCEFVQVISFDSYRSSNIESTYKSSKTQEFFANIRRVFDAQNITDYKKIYKKSVSSVNKSGCIVTCYRVDSYTQHGYRTIKKEFSATDPGHNFIIFYSGNISRFSSRIYEYGLMSYRSICEFMDIVHKDNTMYFVHERYKNKLKGLSNYKVVDFDYIKNAVRRIVPQVDEYVKTYENSIIDRLCRGINNDFWEVLSKVSSCVDIIKKFDEFIDGLKHKNVEPQNMDVRLELVEKAYGKDLDGINDKYEKIIKDYCKEKFGLLYCIYSSVGIYSIRMLIEQHKNEVEKILLTLQ